ncbi:hypothetical protein SRABI83_00785 [Arthrobacter sp. Bi83]|nr:hypothetical protein SRABI83_00785 [Arthrobacter sp. Bi83]
MSSTVRNAGGASSAATAIESHLRDRIGRNT